jgi:hypothetical protein
LLRFSGAISALSPRDCTNTSHFTCSAKRVGNVARQRYRVPAAAIALGAAGDGEAQQRRSGHELIGPCPRHSGTDRFQLHTVKNTWLCRRCAAGGDFNGPRMNIV